MNEPLRDSMEQDNTERKKEESSINSPDFQAFLDLIDREAHRLQMLDEKHHQSTCKPMSKNSITWQPSFRTEDFTIASKETSSRNHITQYYQGYEEHLQGEKEGGQKRGIKRARNLSPLFVHKEKIHKNNSGKVVVCDWNKKDEFMDGTKF